MRSNSYIERVARNLGIGNSFVEGVLQNPDYDPENDYAWKYRAVQSGNRMEGEVADSSIEMVLQYDAIEKTLLDLGFEGGAKWGKRGSDWLIQIFAPNIYLVDLCNSTLADFYWEGLPSFRETVERYLKFNATQLGALRDAKERIGSRR